GRGTDVILIIMSARSSSLRPPARRTGLWVAGILVCSALFIGVYEYFVRSFTGQLIELTLLNASEYFEHPLPTVDLSAPWNMVLVVAVPAALFVVIAVARQKFLTALIAVGVMVGANLSTQVLKHTWLDKPMLVDGPQWPEYWVNNTLPSGHTTLAASIAVAVFLVASPRQRPLFAVLIAVYSGALGAYTFIETWHTPADVMAAYLVVSVWALAGGWLIMRAEPRHNTVIYDDAPDVAPAAAFSWFLGVVLSLGALACLVIGGGWSAMAAPADDISLWHWFAGVLICVGPAFLVAAAAINLFGAESGTRQRGAEVPSPKGERLVYPVPPELRELYQRV
ncbi:MAG: phosphatase PAP2 family protein, partial [Nesterenkonia sp.]